MTAFPWMPLYIADYHADTAHLTTAEHGAYLLLIMHYWTTGGLPDDDRRLARIVRMSGPQWRRSRPVLAKLFSDGWKHKRVEFELTEAAKISSAGRTGGIASGIARRAKKLAESMADLNGRSTVVERSYERLPNDSRTIREALHPHPHTLSPKEGERGAPNEKNKPKNKGSRLPDDWQPDDDAMIFASEVLGAGRVHEELAKFRDYWLAKAGKDAVKANWTATWRNWCRRSAGDKSQRNGFHYVPRPGSKEAQRQEERDALDQLTKFYQSDSDDAGGSRRDGRPDAPVLPFHRRA